MTVDPGALIDDPSLSREFKVQLLQAWVAAVQEDEASWQPYLDDYGLDQRDWTPSDDQRYTALLEDGRNAQKANASRIELGERLWQDCLNVPDEMLDLGAWGLGFFELFLPAARRLGYESRELADYYSRFDAERGMRLQSLAQDVETLGNGLEAGRTEHAEHEKCLSALRAGWSGITATAATETVQGHCTAAEADLDRLASLVEVLSEANLTLSAAVTTKAYKVVSLHQPTVGGYSAAQIDGLADIYVGVRDGDYYLAEDRMMRASYWFPELAGGDFRYPGGLCVDGGGGSLTRLDRDDIVGQAAGIVKRWFDTNFQQVYEEKRQEFTTACDECAEAVDAAYDAAIAEARTIETQACIPSNGITDPESIINRNGGSHAGRIPSTPPEPIPAQPNPGPASTVPTAAPADRSGGGGATATAPAAHQSDTPVLVVPPAPGVVPAPAGFPGGVSGFGDVPGIGAASGPGELGSMIRTLIEDAVSELTGGNDADLGDEFGDSREEEVHAGQAGVPPEKSLELLLGGKSWTLSIDENSEGIHLEMTDEQGGTARFSIEVGPNGLPRIVEETDTGEAPFEAAPNVKEEARNPDTAGDPGLAVDEDAVLGGNPADYAPQHEETTTPVPPEVPEGVPHPSDVTPHEPSLDAPAEPGPLWDPLPDREPAHDSEAGDSGAELAEAGPL
ncbi:hypothetical protein [Rhodococcus sp. NPDC049939]|uniref:hypothetical protein n=1 Tax=Rhodococcus sp. NPDC049939 TaxID=3155511 RepID=UPI0033D78045